MTALAQTTAPVGRPPGRTPAPAAHRPPAGQRRAALLRPARLRGAAVGGARLPARALRAAALRPGAGLRPQARGRGHRRALHRRDAPRGQLHRGPGRPMAGPDEAGLPGRGRAGPAAGPERRPGRGALLPQRPAHRPDPRRRVRPLFFGIWLAPQTSAPRCATPCWAWRAEPDSGSASTMARRTPPPPPCPGAPGWPMARWPCRWPSSRCRST
jgi:hypothetical protein